ncbi:MAG: hypothetical protein P1V13_21155 [Rhizobiaceae bacterium]|nr:hypothetical protein [Rhizobiaceae bacterium]
MAPHSRGVLSDIEAIQLVIQVVPEPSAIGTASINQSAAAGDAVRLDAHFMGGCSSNPGLAVAASIFTTAGRYSHVDTDCSKSPLLRPFDVLADQMVRY